MCEMLRVLKFIACVGCLAFCSPRLGADDKAPAKPNLPYNADLVREIVADAQKNGDARRGAMLFGLPTSACLSCHKVGAKGSGSVGPELTKVGICLKPEEIVEGVLWPNRTVKPEFMAIAVTTTSGKSVRGVLHRETTAEVELIDSSGKLMKRRFSRKTSTNAGTSAP